MDLVSPVHTLEEQGIQFNSVLRVKKITKEDKKRLEKTVQKTMKERAVQIKQTKEKEEKEMKAKEKQDEKVRKTRMSVILRDGFDKVSPIIPLIVEETISWLEQNGLNKHYFFLFKSTNII